MTEVHVERIEEEVVDGKRLGRHVEHDERSRAFAVETTRRKLVSVCWPAQGLPLNQGDLGKCTAEALCGNLNTDPNSAKLKDGPWTDQGSDRLYGRETADEGQPWPPNDPGGSGLAVCKAAKELGMISSYRHAFSIDSTLNALLGGPCMTGVSWYSSFDTPDKRGLVSIGASAYVRGGHEFELSKLVVPDGAGYDDLDDILVGAVQSWGLQYGVADPDGGLRGGRFYMTAATLKVLLSQRGDVTVPVL